MTEIEHERQYVVVSCPSFRDFPLPYEVESIEQFYLAKLQGAGTRRIRRAERAGQVAHDLTQKKKVGHDSSRRRETSIPLTEAEYVALKQLGDPARNPIVKTRAHFSFEDQHFELNAYEGKLVGVRKLEIENPPEAVRLPPWLVAIDVTEDKRFRDAQLAKYGADEALGIIRELCRAGGIEQPSS